MTRNFLFIIILFLSVGTFAQEIPDRPSPARLVNDFANVLTEGQTNQLESNLSSYARQTSTQIVIVTVESLDGYDSSDYAFQLGEKWGIGQAGKDNGVVVLFKPKTATGSGQVFVAIGYGLEGVIPDAIANRNIVNNEMIPHFQNNDIYGGFVSGTQVIMDLAAGEYTADQYVQKTSGGTGKSGVAIFLFILFFVIIPIFRGRSRRYYSSGGNLPFWLLMGGMMNSGHGRGGSWGNFSGGSGSFGGSGGFGGFGGGGFGGGGAGGSW